MLIPLPLSAIVDAQISKRFDLVVYGGTAGGVITAVTAACEGLSVALLEPTNHLGGMVSGGLSATDHGEAEFVNQKGRPPRFDEILLPRDIANGQWDFNNRGSFSTDYIGKNWDYPNSSYQRRAEIWQDHVNYTKGLFYFLTHNQSVPKPLQDELNEFGLAKDEFTDNEHWPYQLYVREARRMVGDFVMTQKDIQTQLTKPDAIGMGSYNSDPHNVQRYITEQGKAQNEGNMEVPVTPYQIPYRLLLPKKSQVTNLLVTVCFSASHVTYSTLRMEPVYMIIGQAAGVAVKMSINENVAVQDIDTAALTAKLLKQRAVME